jgi:uncharacterized protein (UPF0371 family)
MSCPFEVDEQEDIALWLDHNQFDWFHVPNEGDKAIQYNTFLKRCGVKKGIVDIIILDSPPKFPYKVGVAIELKRQEKSVSKVSKEQKEWIDKFDKHNWATRICYGAKEAKLFLLSLGFKERPITDISRIL